MLSQKMLIDLFMNATQNNNFSYFSYKQKTTSIDQFIMPNLVYMRGFIRIFCKLEELWDAKLANFYREMYGRGQVGIHFSVKISKFGVSYFHQFVTDSYETSHIY